MDLSSFTVYAFGGPLYTWSPEALLALGIAVGSLSTIAVFAMLNFVPCRKR